MTIKRHFSERERFLKKMAEGIDRARKSALVLLKPDRVPTTPVRSVESGREPTTPADLQLSLFAPNSDHAE